MDTTDKDVFQELLREGTAAAIEESLRLHLSAGEGFAELIRSGALEMGVDRACSRDFFLATSPTKLLEATGHNLRGPIYFTRAAHFVEAIGLLLWIVLSVVAFGPVGVISLPAAVIVFNFGSRSNMRPDGWLSIWLALAFFALMFTASSTVQLGWAATGFLIAIAQKLRYAIPSSVALREAFRSSEVRGYLIEAGAVRLRFGGE